MDLFETSTHSFIIKIWREWTGKQPERATWRGHITHIPGGERRYLREIDDILIFILPYLETMEVQASRWLRACRWLRKRRLIHRKRGRSTNLGNDD